MIDECQSNPCPRHSQCLDQSNGYKCVCGKTNEMNKKRKWSFFVCIREPGWTGRDCQEDIDECDLMKPCKAARKCTNQPGSYQCECLENFLGKNCEMVNDHRRINILFNPFELLPHRFEDTDLFLLSSFFSFH